MSRKRRDEGGGGDSWLNTYADMVTLLLTFFAVMLSMSSIEEEKFNSFIKSFSNLPQEVIEEITTNAEIENGTSKIVNEINSLYESMKEYIAENNQEEMIEISKIDGIIYVRFKSSLFFEPNQYILRSESLPVLDFIGGAVKGRDEYIKMVNVLGFTATIENGTYWMLSGERAAVVASYLNETVGFDTNKLTVIGYGNRYPVATNATDEGRKKNRRVEMVIVSNEGEDDFNISESMEKVYGTNGIDPNEIDPNEIGDIEEDVSPYEE